MWQTVYTVYTFSAGVAKMSERKISYDIEVKLRGVKCIEVKVRKQLHPTPEDYTNGYVHCVSLGYFYTEDFSYDWCPYSNFVNMGTRDG